MSDIDQLVPQMFGAKPGAWLWWIEERSLAQYAARPRQQRSDFAPVTASMLTQQLGGTTVIAVHGVMVPKAYWEDETSTPVIEEAIRLATSDGEIESVLFDIDSPGGSTSGLAELADAMDELVAKKPVAVQSRGMLASAAYYFASRAPKIYAQRMDLVGSIGTRMMVYDFSGWFEQMGVKAIAINTGPLKSAGAFGTAITDDQKEYLQGIVNHFQQDFAASVQRGRHFTQEQLAAVSSGAVFPAAEALKLGLIDGLQTINKTLSAMPRRQTSTTSQRSKPMSETNTAHPVQPATLAELKAALPGSTAEFREQQIEAGATLTQSLTAWATHLQAENARLVKQLEDDEAEKKKQEEDEKKKTEESKQSQRRGNKPVVAGADGATEIVGSAKDRFMAFVTAKVAAGLSRERAVRAVAHEHPDLREAMVAEANARS